MLYPLWQCPTSAGEDDLVYFYPVRKMLAEQVRSGQLPLWNDREAAGVPLLADPQSGSMFPPNWLFLILPTKLAYSLAIFLAFAVAGGGAYLYFKRIGLAGPAVAFGAAAFTFCGFMVGHRVHLGMIQTAGLLPWGLWGIERIRISGRAALAWMAPIFALALAAGHWPSAVHLILVWLVYLLLRGRPFKRALVVALGAVLLGAAAMAPQIAATASFFRHSVRSHLPYSVVGENSFFPLSAVLGFFPFIMGCRTPNFFPQKWWGPWHLCEMLGYVGLITLVLAAAAVWRLYRGAAQGAGPPFVGPKGRSEDPKTSGVPPVKVWTWIALAAGLWAVGTYLPTYALVYRIPILGKLRCPARMLLVVDFALAALAAMAIHSLVRNPTAALARTLRWAAAALPACMFGLLVLLAFLALVEGRWWHLEPLLSIRPGDAGAAEQIRSACNPLSPAVYVPFLLAGATVAAVWWVLRAPARRAALLTVLVLADLFFIARLVDVPGRGRACPDPENSPAAAWLRANAPKAEPYRLWGLSREYHHRPAELLLPKSCAALGFETISQYGPLQPTRHARLFGFKCWGENRNWPWLIRRNYLLSLFNVRYILAADPEFRSVIESVRIPVRPPAPPGPNLLSKDWQLDRARRIPGGILLRAAYGYSSASAVQRIRLEPGQIYRIALDARAPEGSGGLLLAEYLPEPADTDWWRNAPYRLLVDPEQLTGRWRHFEWTFRAPASAAGHPLFRILTYGGRPVEVGNVKLCRSEWEVPINLGGRLAPGEVVYVDRTPLGLRSVRPGDAPVHVYENMLCLPRSFAIDEAVRLGDDEQVEEALRWDADEYDLTRQVLTAGKDWLGGDAVFVSENLPAQNAAWGGRAGPVLGANVLGGVVWRSQSGGRPLVNLKDWVTAGGVQGLALASYLILLFRRRRMNRGKRHCV